MLATSLVACVVFCGTFESSVPKLEIDDAIRSPSRSEASGGRFVWEYGDVAWVWDVRREAEWTVVRSRIENRGQRDVRLGRCDILDAEGGVLAGRSDLRFLDLQRLQLRQRTVRSVSDPRAAHDVPIHIQFAEPDGTFALQFGFTTFTTLETTCRWEGTNGVVRVRASGAFENWTLKAGASTPFEEFAVAVGRDPHAQLVRWAERVAANYRPKFIRTPALGLSGGAWTHLAGGASETSEASKYNKAAALAKLLPGYGFKYAWISNTNIPGGNPGDWKGWNSANHPLGREGTARRYAGIGWIMGSWAGPFMLSSGLKEMNEEFSDSIYRRADGAPWVFKNAWAHGDAGKLPPEKRPAIYALDPSCPKVIDKLRDDFSYLREQGVRYYMLDFLQTGLAYGGAGPDAPRFSGKDGSRSRVEAFYKAMTAIREAAGPETYLLGCSGPTFCCVGAVDGVRTAGDLGEGRAITRPGTFFYPASYGINRLNFWTGPERALYNTASYYTHGRLFNNDLGNVLTVGEPMPVEHARINAAIHAFAGSSSMFGDDPRDISSALRLPGRERLRRRESGQRADPPHVEAQGRVRPVRLLRRANAQPPSRRGRCDGSSRVGARLPAERLRAHAAAHRIFHGFHRTRCEGELGRSDIDPVRCGEAPAARAWNRLSVRPSGMASCERRPGPYRKGRGHGGTGRRGSVRDGRRRQLESGYPLRAPPCLRSRGAQ